jgi:hypothetical protein
MLQLPRDFEIDNIYISHDSDNSDLKMKRRRTYYNDMVQGVIDELMENNHTPFNDDDI